MNDKIKLAENVMLIDAAYLNFVVADMKKHFERLLNRPLQPIDTGEFVSYLALDAGIGEAKNEIQILFVYDKDSSSLFHATPSDLQTELDGVAFQSTLGEFTFAGVPSAEMVPRADLFLDLVNIVSDSKEVKRFIVVSFNEEYGDKVSPLLNKMEKKKVIQFRMDEPEEKVNYQWEFLPFPLMQALGIRGDEL